MEERRKKRNYRRHDAEFKENAVKLLNNSHSLKEVFQALGVNPSTLSTWKKLSRSSPSADNEEQEELRTLKKKLKQIEQERDILKKL